MHMGTWQLGLGPLGSTPLIFPTALDPGARRICGRTAGRGLRYPVCVLLVCCTNAWYVAAAAHEIDTAVQNGSHMPACILRLMAGACLVFIFVTKD